VTKKSQEQGPNKKKERGNRKDQNIKGGVFQPQKGGLTPVEKKVKKREKL